MTGPVYYRRTGRIAGIRSDSAVHHATPPSGPRRVRIRLGGWGEPGRPDPSGTPRGTRLAWFCRGGIDLRSRPELRLQHDGRRVGQTVALIDGLLGLDAIADVDPGDDGDNLLHLVDAGLRVNVSATFLGQADEHPYLLAARHDLAMRRGVLTEVAIVDDGAIPSARILGRSAWPAP
jgi:hypothetical protein